MTGFGINSDIPVDTLLVTHPCFVLHEAGPGHPERPSRMRAIDAELAGPDFDRLRREEAPLRDDLEDRILKAHSELHFDRVKVAAAHPEDLPMYFDQDTGMSSGTWEAARRAVGAGLRAVDAVMDPDSGIVNAFCQVRPPGHHAEHDNIMGFCIFNNVAIAALYARAKHGAERIAVVDFDVHHGNGTQDIFWSDKNLFYGSTHQMPLYPGTGAMSERGAGNIWNAPLRPGDDGAPFRDAIETRILPALRDFGPDMIFISAGFDAHADDPLAALRLVEADFQWVTMKIVETAHALCGGRIVSFLEGGYALDALGRSTAAHVKALMAGT
jgi:acetoin utilization deacetylase AcuC-like enzyme